MRKKVTTTADLIRAIENADEGGEDDYGSRNEKSAKQLQEEAERSAELARRRDGWSKALERAREESRSLYGNS